MSHQPYVDYIFFSSSLAPEQQAALEEHLLVCRDCHSLADAWAQAEAELKSAPLAAPEAGFVARWQINLERGQVRLARRQSLLALGFSLGAAALVLGSLFLLAWPIWQSPGAYFWTYVYQLVGYISSASMLGDLLIGRLQAAGGGVLFLLYLLAAGTILALGMLWLISYRYLLNPKRVIS